MCKKYIEPFFFISTNTRLSLPIKRNLDNEMPSQKKFKATRHEKLVKIFRDAYFASSFSLHATFLLLNAPQTKCLEQAVS